MPAGSGGAVVCPRWRGWQRANRGFRLDEVQLVSGRRGTLVALLRERGMAAGKRFIERLPQRYLQPLGERGSSLSVGERQLISFARALAFDPRILILDEATSSVDSVIEAQIELATAEVMKGRTSLVIAHRLSTVQNADRILVMHHGELREEGTHAELLARGGLYARLYELQFTAVA